MNNPHLTLLPSLVDVDVAPNHEPSEPPSGRWLSSEFGDTKVPFDDLADAVRMFADVHATPPDTLYVHTETQFWLSVVRSNFHLDGEPKPEPVWVSLTDLDGIVVTVSDRVPKGWWFLVVRSQGKYGS